MNRILIAASTLALAASAALAQDTTPGNPPDELAGAMTQPSPENASQPNPAPDITSVITKDDIKNFGAADFRAADANGDGKVDQAEFVAYAAANPPPAGAVAQEDYAQGDKIAEDAASDTVSPEKAFASMSGGKKTVTLKQYLSGLLNDFERADVNMDNKLDENENRAFALLVRGKSSE